MRYAVLIIAPFVICGCAEVQDNSDTVTTQEPASAVEAETTAVAFNVEGAPTVEFNVPGMMCPHGCAPKVKEALAAQPGVKEVKVEYESKMAYVAVDEEQFDPQAAIAVLEDDYGFEETTLKDEAADKAPESDDAPSDQVES